MKLTRLTLENCLGAPNGTFAFTRPNSGAPLSRVFLTGPAASGKTSLLLAIIALKESVGAYGAPPIPKRLLRRGSKSGRIQGTFQLSTAEAARAGLTDATFTATLDLGEDVVIPPTDPALRELFASFSRDPSRGKLEYFPSNRRLGGWESQTAPPSSTLRAPTTDAEARLRVSSSGDKYASIPRTLIDLALSDGMVALRDAGAKGILFRADQRDSLSPYRDALSDFLPSLRLIGVDVDDGAPALRFERPDGTRIGIGDLSDCERQALIFCATARWIGLSESVILIDTPELLIHPDWQSRFTLAMGRLGQDNQLFFATSAAEVLRTAEPAEIVHLGQGPR